MKYPASRTCQLPGAVRAPRMHIRAAFLAVFTGLLLILVNYPGATQAQPAANAPRSRPALEWTFEEWKEACAKLPSNRSLYGTPPAKRLLPLPQFSDFDTVLTAFLEMSKTGPMSAPTNWVGSFPGPGGFFNTSTAYFAKTRSSASPIAFQPFAQKIDVPADSQVFVHADFHGDIHSLLTDLTWLNQNGFLSGFKVAQPKFYMIFLGDYTDRGSFGIEVLYTLLRLKVANPAQVFLGRGNHEELSLQARYGFLAEGRAKYGNAFDAQKLFRAYDFLPVVTYLGSGDNFIQCNHGGMEPGYNPRALIEAEGALRFQLLGKLRQEQFLSQHPEWFARADAGSRETVSHSLHDFQPEDPISPSVIGFMWNDFSILRSEPQFSVDPGRAFVYGEKATQFLLENGGGASRKLRAVFRGHQQSSAINPMMRRLVAGRGVFRHWQAADSSGLLNASVEELASKLEHGEERAVPAGSVWTFNVSPDSIYGENCRFGFDAFGILKTAAAFGDWRLRVVNVTVVP